MQSVPHLPSMPQPMGQTFKVAMSILGGIALVQIVALTWYAVSVSKSGGVGVKSAFLQKPLTDKAPEPSAEASFAPPLLKPMTAEAIQQDDSSVLGDQMAVEAEKRLLESLPRPTPVLAPREINQTTRVNDLINLARTLRDRGDTSTALTRLREAQMLSPQNLQIISEMAITFERMSLIDKAVGQWRRIYEQGEKAGIYYAAAEAKLSALQLPSDPNAPQQALPYSVSGGDVRPPESSTAISISGAVLAAGDVRTVDDTGNSQLLRRLKLRIPILAQPESMGQVDVHDVVLQIYFYDQLKGGKVVETNANVNSSWVSSPIDWSSEEPEILEVSYSQAEVGLAAPPDASRRNYFGYVVRVYYKGDLNALYAEPKKLLQLFPPPKTLNVPTSDLPQ